MEREKLFYDLHLAIKEVANNPDFSFEKIQWYQNLYTEIMKMNDSTLDMLLDTFSRLKEHSYYNISFIILQSEKLKNLFYKDGRFIEEKLVFLHKPYDFPFYISSIITEYCFYNNIPVKEFDRYVLLKTDIKVLEKIIQEGEKVNNSFIARNLDFFFDIYEHSPKFAASLKLGPLHDMQITIYKKTIPEDANSERKKYINYLSKYNNSHEKILNKVIEYIKDCEFIEHETIEIIGAMDIECLDELIEKYGKKTVFEKILPNQSLRRLSKLSPKILMNLLDLHLKDESDKKLNETAKNLSNLNFSQLKAIEEML